MSSTTAKSSEDPQHVLDEINYQFQLKPETLQALTRAFLDEYAQGLSSYNHPMAMIPTFVTGVPDGTETGTFLALDLGGTNMRVCEVELKGDQTFTLRQQKYKVSDQLKTGEASTLFDYLADSVDAFLTTKSSKAGTDFRDPDPSETVHLGLTFSFPVEQSALDSGKILTWTKGFSARNAIGNDVVKLLQDAFNRKHMHVKCVALVNDTVGALLSRAYTSGGCILGAIFGTGTNGAYVEQVANITKLGNSEAASKGGLMVINTEWGAFNNSRSHLPSTPYDMTLDRQSINPKFQAFEKFISGMYLGEIVRHVLLSLIDATPKAIIFNGVSSKALNSQWGLDTSVMSEIELAWEHGDKEAKDKNPTPAFKDFNDDELEINVKKNLEAIRDVIVNKLGLEKENVSLRDASIVRWICSLVATRAAHLSGVAVAATLLQTQRACFASEDGSFSEPAVKEEKILIGVDGSLIEHYPNYELTMRESIRVLVGSEVEKRVVIGLAKDGSGVGAALCALQALKQN